MERPIPLKPLSFLILFTAANALVSYSSFSPEIEIAVILLGIALPLLYLLRERDPGADPAEGTAVLAPLWVWAALAFLMVFLRFYRLTTLFAWPTLDEGWIGALAVDLSRNWNWKFFYTFGETPPLAVWSTALLLKAGLSPAVSLWFPPAAASALTVVAGTLASRQFFSGSFTFVFACLLAFSQWPLFIGRFCHQGSWLPLWTCVCFYLLGRFLKAMEKGSPILPAAALGAAVGLGSFTFTPWPVPAFFFGCVVFAATVWKSRERSSSFSIFLASALLTSLPFFLAVLREGYGRHILSLSPLGGWFHSFNFIPYFLRYFASLLWSPFESDPAYTPVWGGFLNPLLGAFFWWGCVEMFRTRTKPVTRWAAAAFVLFLLPGGLSPNVEMFRVAPVLPLLVWVTALGLHSFLSAWPRRGGLVLALVLVPSLTFDLFLLTAPYRNPDRHPADFGKPLKSMERYRAFQELESTARAKGPGVVFTAFDVDALNDPTLSYMTAPFNLAVDPAFLREEKVDPARCRWMAVFVNLHYGPFLQKRFPEGKWLPLSRDLTTPNGGTLLGVIPLDRRNAGTASRWLRVHAGMEEADLRRYLDADGRLVPTFEVLKSTYPDVRGDPFLESVYWDKVAAYEYVVLDYDANVTAYRNAVDRGYPTADLCFKLGSLCMARQDIAGSRAAFGRAVRAPLDLTPSRKLLDWLDEKYPAQKH